MYSIARHLESREKWKPMGWKRKKMKPMDTTRKLCGKICLKKKKKDVQHLEFVLVLNISSGVIPLQNKGGLSGSFSFREKDARR